jgi:hypothetical protein
MYAGGLNVVMGKIFHHTPSTIVRITLVSLAVAAERVRFLAEREEIEVDDLPPPTIPPTLTKVKAGVSGYTNGYVMRRMRFSKASVKPCVSEDQTDFGWTPLSSTR